MPTYDPLVERPTPKLPSGQRDLKAYTVTESWVKWFTQLSQGVSQSSVLLSTTSLTSQAASITTTTINTGPLNAGLYRITWYARITQAASSSSSLTITIGWTDASVAVTYAGSAITGNTTTTFQSVTQTVYSDRLSDLTYATTYSSTGATAMQHSLYIVVEKVSA